MNLDILKKIHVKDILGIILGAFILSIGINFFLKNAGLLSGGVTGIALILNRLFHIQTGLIIICLNIPIFITSFIKLNRKFTIYSFIGMITLSLGLIITEPLINLSTLDDKLLLAIYGGTLSGIGCGIIFLNHGSTGGADIMSMLLRKKFPSLNISQILFGINILVVSIGAILFGLSSALYTLISMYASSLVLDNIIKGFHAAKSVFIITDKESEISTSILSELERGVTKICAEGAYTSNSKTILYCVVPLSQLPDLKALVKEIDKNAFLTISDTSEIMGKGFKKPI